MHRARYCWDLEECIGHLRICANAQCFVVASTDTNSHTGRLRLKFLLTTRSVILRLASTVSGLVPGQEQTTTGSLTKKHMTRDMDDLASYKGRRLRLLVERGVVGGSHTLTQLLG